MARPMENGRENLPRPTFGRQSNVGRENIVSRKRIRRSAILYAWCRTVGRQRYVGRENPLPTGLMVTDTIGR
jgi:hypothetical protein